MTTLPACIPPSCAEESTDPHDESLDERQRLREAIVEEALGLAPFDGLSQATLIKAAVQAGLAPMEAERLLPGGVEEALDVYTTRLDRELRSRARQADLAAMRVHERIIWLVMTRLEQMAPHKEALRRAIAMRALPWNAPSTCRDVWHVSNLMWRLAGDASTDFNYYTKRTLLAEVYVTTVLCWLQDSEPEHEATRAFLERRVAEVLRFGKQLGQCSNRVSQTVERVTDQWVQRRRYRTKRT